MNQDKINQSTHPWLFTIDYEHITEARLQQICFLWHWITYPEERGRLYMVYNSPKNAIDGVMLIGEGMIPGVSDLHYLLPGGHTVAIECKIREGFQSEYQKWWQQVCEELSHPYELFRTVPEFQYIIQKWRASYPQTVTLPIMPLREGDKKRLRQSGK